MSPLIILVVFSLAAIGGVALLLHRLGHSAATIFSDEEAVTAAFSLEFPELEVDEVSLAADRRSALLTLANTPAVGVLRAMGKFSVAKTVSPTDIGSCSLTGRTLLLQFRDFADPAFQITFVTEGEACNWAALFDDRKGSAAHA